MIQADDHVVEAVAEAGAPLTSALSEALSISAVALVAIFLVMGLLGVLIALLGRLLPERVNGET